MCSPLFSADINEDELFGDPDAVITEKPSLPEKEEEKKVGFSGEITSAAMDIVSSTSARNSLYTYTVANIFLDARMKSGLKAFANMETTYLSQTKTTEVALREMFFDFNYRRKAYFRTGKQVLQWGRCYLWNPTDHINIERQTFIRRIGYREGAYGTKFHVPFGTKANIYGFFDTGSTPEAGDIACALKYEFLVGGTEMAFSAWGKNTYNPVLGYDISSRIGTIDIMGEASVSKGENVSGMKEENGTLFTERDNDKTISKASVNFTKRFRLGNFKDRVTFITEFYYNGAGYENNEFADNTVYAYDTATLNAISGTYMTTGTKKDYLVYNSLYEANEFSRYYGAMFLTIDRFIISDMSLNINVLQNASDGSGLVSAGTTYKNINDFSAGILVNAYYGMRDSEYTFSSEALNVQLTFGVSF